MSISPVTSNARGPHMNEYVSNVVRLALACALAAPTSARAQDASVNCGFWGPHYAQKRQVDCPGGTRPNCFCYAQVFGWGHADCNCAGNAAPTSPSTPPPPVSLDNTLASDHGASPMPARDCRCSCGSLGIPSSTIDVACSSPDGKRKWTAKANCYKKYSSCDNSVCAEVCTPAALACEGTQSTCS
jgi:hypothetical protein